MSDFDFIETEEEYEENQLRELYDLEPKKNEIVIETATSGNPQASEAGLTPEVIKEARRLAGSKKGLDINTFFIEHQLIGVKLDDLLHGKLDEDGNLL